MHGIRLSVVQAPDLPKKDVRDTTPRELSELAARSVRDRERARAREPRERVLRLRDAVGDRPQHTRVGVRLDL
jgi:hypothetical protein